jgi:hypothetical protein
MRICGTALSYERAEIIRGCQRKITGTNIIFIWLNLEAPLPEKPPLLEGDERGT